MTTELSADDIKRSIIAKSDQINADDLIAGPITARVMTVRAGSAEQPLDIGLEGYHGKWWRPCKTDRRVIVAAWGADPRAWLGRSVTLYRDASAMWGGVAVGGVRIAAMSDIPASGLDLSLAVKKGKKDPRHIDHLSVTTKPADTHEAKRARLVAGLDSRGLLADAVEAHGQVETWDAEVCKEVAGWMRSRAAAEVSNG